jgi:hypothetical protein
VRSTCLLLPLELLLLRGLLLVLLLPLLQI